MQTLTNSTVSPAWALMWNQMPWTRRWRLAAEESGPASPVRIGLALGGGFARGIAHAGVLSVLEQHHIPIHCITGISAGAIVAAAYASGTTPDEIARAGCSMRFGDVGRLSLSRLGLAGSHRMNRFLKRLLKSYRFEEMRIPLGVVATDLSNGEPVPYAGTGSVFDPIRASCAYSGRLSRCAEREVPGGRRDEHGGAGCLGASARRHPRNFGDPARSRSIRAAEQHVPGGKPLFPDPARPVRE